MKKSIIDRITRSGVWYIDDTMEDVVFVSDSHRIFKVKSEEWAEYVPKNTYSRFAALEKLYCGWDVPDFALEFSKEDIAVMKSLAKENRERHERRPYIVRFSDGSELAFNPRYMLDMLSWGNSSVVFVEGKLSKDRPWNYVGLIHGNNCVCLPVGLENTISKANKEVHNDRILFESSPL